MFGTITTSLVYPWDEIFGGAIGQLGGWVPYARDFLLMGLFGTWPVPRWSTRGDLVPLCEANDLQMGQTLFLASGGEFRPTLTHSVPVSPQIGGEGGPDIPNFFVKKISRFCFGYYFCISIR